MIEIGYIASGGFGVAKQTVTESFLQCPGSTDPHTFK